jgi:hypothetical protein
MSYPPQIEHFQRVLGSLPGVTEVSSGIESLQGVGEDLLRFPDFAALPIGALRRTGGGLEAEALIQFEFRLNPNAKSWRTIEFLAWFIRDQSRGGVSVQLRPFALPPEVQGRIQLGHTLRWQIDLFCASASNDLSPQLEQVEGMAHALEIAIQVYAQALAADA